MLLSLTFTIYTHAVNLRCIYAYMYVQTITNFCLLFICEAQSHCVSACFTSRFQLLYGWGDPWENVSKRMENTGQVGAVHTHAYRRLGLLCMDAVLFFAFLTFFLFLVFGFFFFAFPSYISGVHHFWVRFLRIKVVTFRLHGWCVLGVFLLPAFTRLGHERQDLLSPCDEMHVCTD